MKIYWKKPKHNNSQAVHGFHRKCHAFFFRQYADEKKEKSPEVDVVGDSRGQDFFQGTSLTKKSHVLN